MYQKYQGSLCTNEHVWFIKVAASQNKTGGLLGYQVVPFETPQEAIMYSSEGQTKQCDYP